MHHLAGRARGAAAAFVALALAGLGAACAPRPTNNEINVSDEGMKNGVAAARYLTPVQLDDVEIGRALNADKSIKDRADKFQAHDTVYASIVVSGSANSGLVRALWTNERGEKIQDDTRIITPSNNDRVALQAAPPQGWPAGRYKLDVYLDDKLADTETFSVEGGESNAPAEGTGVPPSTTSH